MSGSTDVGVVGAGIVGLSAAYAAVERGLTVTVYEPGPPGGGQSAGQSRIFRHAHDDPRLVELAVSSRAAWREWEGALGVELVSGDGAVALGSGVRDKLDILGRVPGLEAREIGPEELAERMPLLAAYDGPAMLDEAGGSIRTRAAVDALAGRLTDSWVHDHVLTLRETGQGTVEVRTGTDRREHGHVVVTAGRATQGLARSLGVEIPVEQGAHVRVTFGVSGPAPDRVATLQDSSGAFGETGVYAAAYPGNEQYAVGLGPVEANPDGSLTDPDELASSADRACRYAARALPGLDPTPVELVHCWVTELPWGEDGVGVWDRGAVSFLAGHNLFKLAPALGRALAAHVADAEPLGVLEPASRLGTAAQNLT